MPLAPKPQIIGHEPVLTYLEKTLKSGKIGQALLFTGPAHIGKKKLINWLIQHENCQESEKPCGTCKGCTSTRAGTNPDIAWISHETPKIAVGDIRELRGHMQKSPLSGQYVWGIIPDAERMTDEAANALLKELEEPKKAARFVLTTSNGDQLLPTIHSRCASINCQLIPEEAIYDALAEVGVDRKKALAVARLSQGRPGIAIRFLKDGEYQREILNISKSFLKLLNAPTSARASIFAESLQEKNPQTILLALQTVLRECLMTSLGEGKAISGILPSTELEQIAKTATPKIWTDRLASTATIEQELHTPSKEQLIFERFFINL